MSKPKRYSIRGFSAAMVEEDNGAMVKWEDYAALESEVAELKERVEFLSQVDSFLQSANLDAETERCIQLETENERLRKAGEAMALTIYNMVTRNKHTYGSDLLELAMEWKNASKGVQK